ncbi:hypothetical protein BG011_008369 [Mortierella polycephala]|uniref:BZIP domain-containing protein n=1 Tax=Mortierella polycephala TaxID=41804 RepID=A0A9P6TX73_9FUNG|nr:hypothetical protein BG011_008369 [Mortierella polycephala]
MALPEASALYGAHTSQMSQSVSSLESALAQFSKLAASIERPSEISYLSNGGKGFDEWLATDLHYGSILSGDDTSLFPSPYLASEESPLLEQETLYSTTSQTQTLFPTLTQSSEQVVSCGNLNLTAQPLGLSTSTLKRAAAALNIPWSEELEKAVLAHTKKLPTTMPMTPRGLRTTPVSNIATATKSSTAKRTHTAEEEEPGEVIAKRAKNTDAARRSRLKKMVKLEGLQVKVSDLESTNTRLNMRVAVLETERNGYLLKEAEQNTRIAQLEAKVLEAQFTLSSRSS